MQNRPRRNRKTDAIRRLVTETRLHTDHLIYPLFVADGSGLKKEISSLPGNFIWSKDTVLKEIEECISHGIMSFILFPKVENSKKDKTGTYSYSSDNFYLNIAKKIKQQFPLITIISDVALDPYSIDGHDGIVEKGKVLNDETLEVLGRMSMAQADAGFDVLGPSDMMDGRVGSIRQVLDQNGFVDTSIMSYTAKYASAYYGPFRDALDSAPAESSDIPKDKKTYQMNPANTKEALIEAELDELEGADFLMVKPALHYLDIIKSLSEGCNLPIAAYHVSGECAMLIAACNNGWLEYNQAMPEVLLSIRRAGCDAIISYFAKDYAKLSL